MRRITSPTSHPHRHCQQSQRIESLVFTNLTQRDEHYRWRHWFTATSYDRLLSLCQCRRLSQPPSVNNEDGEDKDNSEDVNKEDADKDKDDSDDDDEADSDEDEDDSEEEANEDEFDSDNDKDNSDDEDDNEDDGVDDSNDKDNNVDDDKEDKDDDEDDDDNDEDDDDNRLGLEEELHCPRTHCIRTQLSIVRRLIVVLGPNFRVSYTTVARPDHRYFTTLSYCIALHVII